MIQKKFGRESFWGINKGWQNEIAIWNIFAAIVISTFIGHDVESNAVIVALFVMSFGFALNHSIALRQNRGPSNIAGGAINIFGLVIILLWALCSKK